MPKRHPCEGCGQRECVYRNLVAVANQDKRKLKQWKDSRRGK